MESADWELRPMGDRAVLLRLRLPPGVDSFAELSSAERYRRMLAARNLAARLQSNIPAGQGWPKEFVPGYDSVLAPFEPEELQAAILYEWLQSEIALATAEWRSHGLREAESSRLHRIPVIYGGGYGPDLESVARRNGLTPEEVISIHTSVTYSVYLLGFAPGFAYLGALPTAIDAPRLERPRPQVGAGTVALAAGLTAVYPFAMPGGWNLIGYTPLPMFEADKEPPARLLPGDKVQFYRHEN